MKAEPLAPGANISRTHLGCMSDLRDPERLSVDIGGNSSTSIRPARMQFSRLGAGSIQSGAFVFGSCR